MAKRSAAEIDAERLARSTRALVREAKAALAEGMTVEELLDPASEWLVESSRERAEIEFGDWSRWSERLDDRIMDWRTALEDALRAELETWPATGIDPRPGSARVARLPGVAGLGQEGG